MDINQAWIYPIFSFVLVFNMVWISSVYDLGLNIPNNYSCWLPDSLKGNFDANAGSYTNWTISPNQSFAPNFSIACGNDNVSQSAANTNQNFIQTIINAGASAIANFALSIPLLGDLIEFVLFLWNMMVFILGGWVLFLVNLGLPPFLVIALSLVHYGIFLIGSVQIAGWVVITLKRFFGG